MRSIYGLGTAIAAGLMAIDPSAIKIASLPEPANFSSPKRRKTGVTYPHSSTRQRARYARQIAAGQIKNAA